MMFLYQTPPAVIVPAPTVGWLQAGVTAGQSFYVTVTLTGPLTRSEPTVVVLSTDSTLVTVPPTITIPASLNFARYVALSQPLPPGSARRFVWLRATVAGATTATRITLEPYVPPGVSGLFAADGVTSLTHALAGTPFLILGHGFGVLPGEVLFDPTGRALVTGWSDTRIIAVVPSAGVGPHVHTIVNIALPGAFTVIPVAPDFTIDLGVQR